MRHPTQLHAGETAWSQIKILIFTRDDALRSMVRATFRRLSVKEILSSSIPDDADHLVSYGIDIALIDFDADSHAAMGFLTRLRAAPKNPNPDMPVLVLVKAADRMTVAPAYHVGIDGVVPKPVSSHELSLRVSEALKTPVRLPVPANPAAQRMAPRPSRGLDTDAPSIVAPPPGRGLETSPVPAQPRPAPSHSHPRDAVSHHPHARPTAAPPVRPAGGKLAAEDVVASPVPAAKAAAIEPLRQQPAPAPKFRLEPKDDDDAARKRAAARKAAWDEALAKSGHKKRKGSDVAALDVSAIVASHTVWLQSQGAEGSRANFQGMDLAGADVSRTVLANATFREVDLSDASLTESRLDGADFRYAKLGAADLGGANLGVAQLRHADLRLANLEGAVLRGADLSGAKLRGARLSGADFKGATMISTDLSEADLSQVENLSQIQVDRSVCDMKTKLPPGVMRPRKDE